MKKLIVIMVLSMFGMGLSAQTHPVKIKKERVDQNAKIKRGVVNGKINPRERKQIKKKQKSVNKAVYRAQADGVITKQERRRINHKSQKVDRSIRRAKLK